MLHAQALIMKIAFAAVFGFQVLCSVGFTAPSSTTEVTGEGVTGDDVSTNDSSEITLLNQIEGNTDLTKNKINESEIFENGQTAKEDRQRSFIYIQNAKSRLPWKSKTRGSFFLDDFTNAKELFNDGDGNFNPCKVGFQPNSNKFYNNDITPVHVRTNKSFTILQSSRGHYDSINYPFSPKFKGRNRMGEKKRLHDLTNDITLPSLTPVTIKSYYRKGFKYPAKAKAQKNMYSQKENPEFNKSVTIPQQIGRHYKMPYVVPVSVTILAPTLGFDNPEENKKYLPLLSDDSNLQKLNKFINHIANKDYTSNDNKFNCFNRDCGNRSRSYRVNTNNGVLRGSKCVCLKSSSAKQRPQRWQPRKISETASEKTAIRSLNTNESDDSYETLMKETKKLSKIVEGME